jgi:hypothetical protein
MNPLEETLADMSQRVSDVENSVSERNRELEKLLNQILKSIKTFESSWSGYWLKLHTHSYFYKFQKPPANALFDPQHASNEMSMSRLVLLLQDGLKLQRRLPGDELTGEAVIPGFTVPVSRLFDFPNVPSLDE